jgi:hypothetical protein
MSDFLGYTELLLVSQDSKFEEGLVLGGVGMDLQQAG